MNCFSSNVLRAFAVQIGNERQLSALLDEPFQFVSKVEIRQRKLSVCGKKTLLIHL